MIRAKDVRIVGLGVLLAAAVAISGGCKPASNASGKSPPELNIRNPEGKADGVKVDAAKFYGDLVQALAKGEANPDWFTVAFKAKVARPKFQNEEQEKLGYDPAKFADFLKDAAKGNFDSIEAIPTPHGTYFASMGKEVAGKRSNCLVRLVPSNDSPGWMVDWLHATATAAPPYRDSQLRPDQNEARIVVIAFLSTLLDEHYELAEALMTRERKVDLAWSITPSDKEQGYNSSLLRDAHLKTWRANNNAFNITRQTISDGKPATFEVDLIDGRKQTRKPHVLTVAKTPTGEWLVDKFEEPKGK